MAGKLYLEHVVSNLNMVIYGYVWYRLFQAEAAWQYLVTYALWIVMQYFVTGFFGVGALKQLDRDYPYIDSSLEPSLLYLVGLYEHSRLEDYPFMSI